MRRSFCITMLLWIIASSGASVAQPLLNDSLVRKLDAAVEGFKERYHAPSMVLVVVQDQKIIYSRASGLADVINKIPATIDTRYPIMSITKTFTATMFMQLVQRKVVTLDEDVRKYLPEFEQNGTTLFQLATHTSGLPRNTPADVNFTKQIDRWMFNAVNYTSIAPSTTQDLLRSLKYVRLEYPKYQFMRYSDRHYSNLGYSMLGIALERATRSSYAHYITANIFKPLQMASSGIITGEVQNGELAKGYIYDEVATSQRTTPFFQPNSALYAGGIYSTANDMAKYLSFQFQQQSKILSDQNKARMIAFNIGWKPAYPYVIHEGAILGYRSGIVFNPEQKLGWVILANGNDLDISRVNDLIAKTLAPAFGKNTGIPLSNYAGTYELKGTAERLKIIVKDGQLYSTYLANELPDKALSPSGGNTFTGVKKGGYAIVYEFLSNERGIITTLNMGQMMWQRIEDDH